MSKKPFYIVAIVLSLIIVWTLTPITNYIARINGARYAEKHFPEMQLVVEDVTYSKAFGSHIITYVGKDNQKYSCSIYPIYFPSKLGQGVFAIEETYKEHYQNQAE